MRKFLRRAALTAFIIGVAMFWACWFDIRLAAQPLSFLHSGPAVPEFIRTPQERCVYVGNDTGHGTGVVLQNGVVVTNFHGLTDDSDIFIFGKVAGILKVVPKEDLAYLSWNVKATPVVYADPKVGEEVYYIGNPSDHKCIQVKLRVVELRGNKFFVDGMVLPGSSGSGVWNAKGELVGLIEGREQIGPYQGFGLAIQSKVLEKEVP